jgi:kinesin family protein 18/19
MSKKYNGDNLPDLDLGTKQGVSSNLQVAIRCRPMLEKDLVRGSAECVQVINETTLIISEPYDADGHPSTEKSRKLQFEFQKVFSKTSSNQEVYNYTTRPLLDGLFDGLNATIFAYGASQTGKTYTIMGNGENSGIIGFAVNDLTTMMESGERMGAVLKISYVEIYNEVIRDLLSTDEKNIDIREDPVKGIFLNNVSEVSTTIKKDIMKMIK